MVGSVFVFCLEVFSFLFRVMLFSSFSVISSQLFISEGVGVFELLEYSPSDV